MTANAARFSTTFFIVLAAAGLGGPAVPRDGLLLTIRLGLKDKAPARWDGQLKLSAGKIISIEARTPRLAKAEGASWKASSRPQQGRRARRVALARPVLVAALAAPDDARATVATAQGEFTFRLGDLALGTPASLLEGRASVERGPFSCRLTSGAEDEDRPAAAGGPDGSVWVAYVAYRHGPPLDVAAIHQKRDFSTLVPKGNGDQVRLLRFDGQRWGEAVNVTKAGLDVWRPAVAVAGDGRVWVVWGQRVGGNWDLYARAYEPGSGRFGQRLRLTTAPGADVYAAAATNPRTGAVAVAWQGWRPSAGSGQAGAFDILAMTIEDGKPARELRLTNTSANEWCPAIAFDSRGNLYVAFDTYEKGDYDVKLATVAGGKVTTTTIAGSPRFEARPTIAVDGQDRMWVAYEVGSPNWGKDWGSVWPGRRGSRLYLERDVAVRCLSGGQLLAPKERVPAEPVRAGYPRGSMPPKRRLALPRLALDGTGTVWLLYRRHASPAGQGERWASFAACLTPDGWAKPLQVPSSANLLDNRPALAAVGREGVFVIHSSDYRTAGTRAAQQNDLFCSVLRAQAGANPPALVRAEEEKQQVSPVHPNEREDVRRIRTFRATVGGKTYRILRGEFHRHTELTSHQDMDGTLEDMWRYALDAAAMDWIGNGDHDNGYGKEYLWWLVQKQTDIFHHPPVFMPMFTYERSVSYPSGHRNAMFARRGIRPLPRAGGRDRVYGTPEKGSPDVKTFYAYLKHFGGICASHTSGTGMGTDWRDNDPEAEPVVEIFQGCRESYEHQGAPAAVSDSPKSRAIGGYRPAGFVWKALMKGYRLGFESSSDHYSTHISYAMVYAEDASREAILDGMKKRHCYGANDNIILDVRCGDHMMGDVFEFRGKPSLRIIAVGTAPIAKLSIIRGIGSDKPRYVYTAEPDKREVNFTWTDQAPEWGKVAYYYVRVEQTRPKGGYGALAWASPMWITPVEK